MEDTLLSGENNKVQRFVFYGTQAKEDLVQASFFTRLQVANMALFFIADCGHDVAVFLRNLNLMHLMLDAIINEAFVPDDIKKFLSEHSIRHHTDLTSVMSVK